MLVKIIVISLMDNNNNTQLEFELSKRDNVRKFNHKIPTTKIDLKEIFIKKQEINNSSPDIFNNESKNKKSSNPQNKSSYFNGYK